MASNPLQSVNTGAAGVAMNARQAMIAAGQLPALLRNLSTPGAQMAAQQMLQTLQVGGFLGQLQAFAQQAGTYAAGMEAAGAMQRLQQSAQAMSQQAGGAATRSTNTRSSFANQRSQNRAAMNMNLLGAEGAGLCFEDQVAAFMVKVIKEMQNEAKAKMKEIKGSIKKAKAAGKKGEKPGAADSRNLMFEELKNIMQKLQQMMQALSNVLNTMHQGAMNSIRGIRA